MFTSLAEFPLRETVEYICIILFINRKIPIEYTKVFSGKSDYLKWENKIYDNRITKQTYFISLYSSVQRNIFPISV